MARARNIKPGFFGNEELAELNPLARILFAGLWTIADREGRLEDRPKRIKKDTLPYDDCDIDNLLDQLAMKKFIIRYEVNGEKYISIPTFKDHQNPHIKESPSKIPAPDLNSISTVQEQDLHGSSPADSLLLIPDSLSLDSLNPIITPIAPNGAANEEPEVDLPKNQQAREVIEYLNNQTGKKFKPTESNLKFIRARFKEGYTVGDCRTVIDNKTADWLHDPKNNEYLRPQTLFRPSNFQGYLNKQSLPRQPNRPKSWDAIDEWKAMRKEVQE